MNSVQKSIVRSWIYIGALISAAMYVWYGPFENKQIAFLAVGGPIFLIAAADKGVRNNIGYGPNGLSLAEFVDENAALKLWMLFYSATLLPFIIYRIYTSRELEIALYALSFGLLIGPLFIVSEYKKYIDAGKNS